jgi:Ca2+-binding RTX toxin-like protein
MAAKYPCVETLEYRMHMNASTVLAGRELVINGSSRAATAITVGLTPDGLDLRVRISTADGTDILNRVFARKFISGIRVVCGTGPRARGGGSKGQVVEIGDSAAPVTTPAVILGGHGNDTLVGGSGPNTIKGGGGNDLVLGGQDHNRLEGGAGKDTLFGGPAKDWIVGGPGDDQIQSGGTAPISSLATAGDDTIYAAPGSDLITFYPDLRPPHLHLGPHDVINTVGISVPDIPSKG